MHNDISSLLVKDIVKNIPCCNDRELVETFIHGITSENERLRCELREEQLRNENKNTLQVRVKLFVLVLSICMVFIDVIVFPLVNHFTLLNNPDAIPISSKIGELVKLIIPMF